MRNRGVSGDFERFAAGLSDSLLYTGFQMTGNAKDAEDLVQETLLKVAPSLEQGAADGSPGCLRPSGTDQSHPG